LVPDAHRRVGNQTIKPTSASSTSIVVQLPAVALKAAGSVAIKVLNPPKSGGPSNAVSFTVTTAAAQIKLSSIAPSTATAGATGAVSLSVTGSGFTTTSRVRFNGSDLKTTFGSATGLTASVPATMLRLAGSVSVAVSDSAGSVVSSPKTFQIQKATSVVSACDYTCADYGYSNGQCYNDWTCGADGCLAQQACATTASSCAYSCADYGYSESQCYADWTCKSGCLVELACTSGFSGGSGSGDACVFLCSDYGYADGECVDDYCCDGSTGCLVDQADYYGP
jgi:hypothetical protein